MIKVNKFGHKAIVKSVFFVGIIVALAAGTLYPIRKYLIKNKNSGNYSQSTNSLASPSPIPTVKYSGIVKDNFDGKNLNQITISLIGDHTYVATSSANGEFNFENVNIGNYQLRAYSDIYSSNPIELDLALDSTPSANISVHLKNPKPSQLSGVVFEDRNRDKKKQSDEPTLAAVLEIYKFITSQKLEFVTTIHTDSNGNYSYTLPAPAKYNINPTHYDFYTIPDGAINVVARGFGAALTQDISYIPSVASGELTVFVYNDRNENSNRDDGEEFIHYQYAQITNQDTHESNKFAVSVDGVSQKFASFGNYYIALVPQDEGWAANYKITQGSTETTLGPDHLGSNVYLGAHKLY